MDYFKHSTTLTTFARNNRKSQTDAEKFLWFHLKNRNLQGYKFRRQFPVANYILDFYCEETKLALELDGSQHISNKNYDEQRSTKLKESGIYVL